MTIRRPPPPPLVFLLLLLVYARSPPAPAQPLRSLAPPHSTTNITLSLPFRAAAHSQCITNIVTHSLLFFTPREALIYLHIHTRGLLCFCRGRALLSFFFLFIFENRPSARACYSSGNSICVYVYIYIYILMVVSTHRRGRLATVDCCALAARRLLLPALRARQHSTVELAQRRRSRRCRDAPTIWAGSAGRRQRQTRISREPVPR